MTKHRPLVVFDYEGTLGTSIRRHYVQYVEALERLRRWSGLDAAPLLHPLQETEFLARYPAAKKVGKLLAIANDSPEAVLTRAWLDRTHTEIIWEYRPEHMLYEQVIDGALETLDAIGGECTTAMVSFTRQNESEFRAHLARLGIAAPGRLAIDQIHAVGADGKSSRDSKAAAIRSHYGELIDEQRARGLTPVMVADAVDDMLAAFDSGLGFIGVCKTGKSSEEEFRAALRVEVEIRIIPDFVRFVPTVGDACCVRLLRQLGSAAR